MSALLLVARQELVLAARARSIQIFAAVFALLALAVAASGYVLTGGVGVQDFARTAASLVQLVLLMVPLMALLLGVMALSGERGSLELLFAQPLARSDILLGKLLGLLGDQLEKRRTQLRETLPIRRVVGPADVAALAVHLMTNTALTGATYDVDGGQQLVPA